MILDEEDADAADAMAARLSYQAAVGKLVARLRPRDFEVLVDLILSRSGWTRLAKVGGTTEGIDVEVENLAVNEIAFVQVKGAAGQGVLDEYVEKFRSRRQRYDRMIFAVHSPNGASPHRRPTLSRFGTGRRWLNLLFGSGSEIG